MTPLHPIQIKALTSLPDLELATRLLWKVWQAESKAERNEVVSTSILRALAFAGNYVFGAYHVEQLVGCAVGFFSSDGTPGDSGLHSHIVGVDPALQNRDVGFAIKRHQREWARKQNLATVQWTFDPLVRRNAHVNLCKLAATVVSYESDFYGTISDGLNTNECTDRLVVNWQLDSPAVAAAVDHRVPDLSGDRFRYDNGAKLIRIPSDIELLRRIRPQEAARWRYHVRGQFQELLGADYQVMGLTKDVAYVLLPRRSAETNRG